MPLWQEAVHLLRPCHKAWESLAIESKSESYLDIWTPGIKKDVQVFLGLAAYYCQFIPEFSTMPPHLRTPQKTEPD